MGSKLYVGGLPYAATETQLNTLFAAHGTVESARVMSDKFTGQSRGFGFVEMSTPEEAQAAITALNGTQMDGRSLTVNEAKPMEPVRMVDSAEVDAEIRSADEIAKLDHTEDDVTCGAPSCGAPFSLSFLASRASAFGDDSRGIRWIRRPGPGSWRSR
jgi:RNA recognition motif-containing protein